MYHQLFAYIYILFIIYLSGNNIIHELTVHNRHELRIDMEDFEGHNKYAEYSLFSVGDETSEYEMTVLGYSGDAGIYNTKKSYLLFKMNEELYI